MLVSNERKTRTSYNIFREITSSFSFSSSTERCVQGVQKYWDKTYTTYLLRSNRWNRVRINLCPKRFFLKRYLWFITTIIRNDEKFLTKNEGFHSSNCNDYYRTLSNISTLLKIMINVFRIYSQSSSSINKNCRSKLYCTYT